MKNNFNKLHSLLSAAIVLFAMACGKGKDKLVQPSTTGTMLDIITSFYKVQNTKADGSVLYQSNLCNNDPKLTKIVQASCVFYDTTGNKEDGDGSPVSIGTHKLVMNGHGTYGNEGVALEQQGLYGTNVTFSITAPSKHIPRSGLVNSTNNNRQSTTNSVLPTINEQSTASTTIYIPAAINITNVPPTNVIALTNGAPTTITWNADPNNTIGVIIVAEYYPEFFNNKASYNAGNKQFIRQALNVPDNGSTSIPWSFFDQFPVGGHITLWVGRGNFAIASNGTYNYRVGGYTATAIWDVSILPPPPPPSINGSTVVNLSTSKPNGSGTITAVPGQRVTVTVTATGTAGGAGRGGSGSSSNSISFYPTGALLSKSPNVLTGGSIGSSAQFIMPASGSITWKATLSSAGVGSIAVE